MAQQMVNGSRHDGSVTDTRRMSKDYAVVNPPFEGKHKKPQDQDSLIRRKVRWGMRHDGFPVDMINKLLGRR